MDLTARTMESILTGGLLLMAAVHRVDAVSRTVAYVGEDAVLGCPLTESYTVSYPRWETQDGTEYAHFGGRINQHYALRVSYNTDNTSLVITNITLSDAGAYRCQVLTISGIKSGISTLYTRIRPQTSVISNRQPDGTVTGTEGKILTLKCTSRGGYPAPTVTWYRGSTQSTALASSNIGPEDANMYTVVTVPYTFTSARADDGNIYICQTSYTSPMLEVLDSVNTTLCLNLKPPQPAVEQVGDVVAGSTVTVRCTTSGFRPADSIAITWRYNGGDYTQHATPTQTSGTDTYTATSTLQFTVQKLDNGGRAKCIVAHPTLATPLTGTATILVHDAPESATVTGNHVIVANGVNPLTLTCVGGVGGVGNAAATAISWTRTSSTGTVYHISTQNPVVLRPTRDDDGDTVTCTVDNGTRSVTSAPATLDLHFSAIASIPRGDETVVEGAPSKDLTCNANSNPAATFTWYKGTSSMELAGERGRGSVNQWTSTYTIVDVDRSHAGRYRCVADNGVGAADGTTMTLTVNYPPDVTATAQLNNGQLVVTCSPVGVPNLYHYSNWVHLWSDGTPISQTPPLAATQTLLLTRLTYRDSGIYKCWAGNGVGLNGAMSAGYTREGSTSVITIESPPIIIGPAEQKVSIKLHEPTIVSITYYSNIAGSTVSCHQVVDNNIQTQSVGEVTTETSPIQLDVYDSVVSEQGTSATVTLTLNTEAELGAYVVKITNSVGTVVVHLLAVPEGPPEMPIDPIVEDVYTTSVNVSWELGYHGGPGQIFIIQYSTDGETWTDGAILDTGNSTSRDRHSVTVDSLSPGTLYSLRIHAYNQHGRSPYTDVINVTTSTIGADGRTSSSAVGPAVGGSVTALIAIALVVVLVVLHKKVYSITRQCKKLSNKYRDHTYANEVQINGTPHEMCQARDASTTRDEGQAAALPYERLATIRVTTSTIYDELNIIGDSIVGDTTRDGSLAGPYATLEPRQGENASIYEELRPRGKQTFS